MTAGLNAAASAREMKAALAAFTQKLTVDKHITTADFTKLTTAISNLVRANSALVAEQDKAIEQLHVCISLLEGKRIGGTQSSN